MTILIIALYVIVGFIVAALVARYVIVAPAVDVPGFTFMVWWAAWPVVLVVIGLCTIEYLVKGKSAGGKG